MVEECTANFMDPKTVSQNYNTTVSAVRLFVHEKGMKLPPADLSKYPDFPKVLEGMTAEKYQEAIKKYWKSRAKKNYKVNIREREKNGEMIPNSVKNSMQRDFRRAGGRGKPRNFGPGGRNFGPRPNIFGPNPNQFGPGYYAEDPSFFGQNQNNFGPGAGYGPAFGQGFGPGPNGYGQGFGQGPNGYGQGFGPGPNGFGQGFGQGPMRGGPGFRFSKNKKDSERSKGYQERKKQRKYAKKQEKMAVEEY